MRPIKNRATMRLAHHEKDAGCPSTKPHVKGTTHGKIGYPNPRCLHHYGETLGGRREKHLKTTETPIQEGRTSEKKEKPAQNRAGHPRCEEKQRTTFVADDAKCDKV